MSGRTISEMGPVSFSLENGALTLRDEVGGGEFILETEGATSFTPASGSWFDVPVDGAVSLEVESLRSEDTTAAAVRDLDGEHYGNVTTQPFSVAAEGTFLDLSASLKTLVYVERGTITGYLEDAGNDAVEALVFEFAEPTQVVIGARSFHEEPAATMTVSDDPEALMEAASYLGSSIKEWSAERSWPTLRGHPPAIEIGEGLDIPDPLSKPETGVTVAVPADTAAVLRVTPLAHYLGAEVVSGDRAELRFDRHTEPLGSGERLEQSVDELLARCTLLDSLVRIGGYYSNPRAEYDELAPELPFYPPELYDEPVTQQLREYLEVPFDSLEPLLPRWPATATLRPTMADAEAVPYLLNSFDRIHVTADGQPRTTGEPSPIDNSIQLSTASTVSPGVASLPEAGRQRMAALERAPGAEASVLFIGDPPSAGGRFDRVNWAQVDIGEGTPTAEYRPDVTRAELRTVLRGEYLYVHYGGRVTTAGFVCSDGILSFDDIPNGDVGVVSFRWDRAETAPLTGLFDGVTVAALPEQPLSLHAAERFGTYLVFGYSVALSTQLAGFYESSRFLGDGSLSVAVRPSGDPPAIFSVVAADGDAYRVSARAPIPLEDTVGRTAALFSQECPDTFHLADSTIAFDTPVSADRLAELAENGGVIRFEAANIDGEVEPEVLSGLGTVPDYQ
ncbi:MAG: hypothetical protein V5A38_12800 [Halolamina sp.]|uniref:hypothetical protein n=1 Tax=Halolamina sp. TaxID=1940283 RepID=UPI002FC34538